MNVPILILMLMLLRLAMKKMAIAKTAEGTMLMISIVFFSCFSLVRDEFIGYDLACEGLNFSRWLLSTAINASMI